MTRATVPAPCRRTAGDAEFCSYCYVRGDEECPFADLSPGLLDTAVVGAASAEEPNK